MLVTICFGDKIDLFCDQPVSRTESCLWYENSWSNFGTVLDLVESSELRIRTQTYQNSRTKIWIMDPAGSMLGMVRFEIFDFRYDTKLWYEL